MRFLPIALLIALSALTAASPVTGPSNTSNDLRQTTGRLIIRLKPTANLRNFDRQLKADMSKDASAGPNENVLVHQYTKGMMGYAGVFSAAIAQKLRSHPDVALVEQDYIGHIDDVPKSEQQSPPSWGLPRISNRGLDLTKPYVYSTKAGEGVTAYVVDTGIDVKHTEFTDRATFGVNFVKNEGMEDGNGHGTHCAGTIAGSTFGLAKKANVVAVKVCSSFGSCATSDVIAGVEYVIKNGKKNKSVVNISLALAPSQALDDMVQKAVDSGIAIICSAGNANGDSCLNSPRRAPAAFAVGATDNKDEMASFSNWGKCLRLFAPGVDVISAKPGGGSQSMSGTSMASPHVTGVAALYLADKEYDNIPDLHKDLVDRSTKDAVKKLRNPATTVNLFAFSHLYD